MTVPISFFREQEDGGPPPPNAIEIDPTALSACAGMPGAKTETSATFLVHGADVRVEGWKGDVARLRCVARALQRVSGELALEVKFVD